MAERLKKEEKEREERRKRVEAIMSRTRKAGAAATPSNTPVKVQSVFLFISFASAFQRHCMTLTHIFFYSLLPIMRRTTIKLVLAHRIQPIQQRPSKHRLLKRPSRQ